MQPPKALTAVLILYVLVGSSSSANSTERKHRRSTDWEDPASLIWIDPETELFDLHTQDWKDYGWKQKPVPQSPKGFRAAQSISVGKAWIPNIDKNIHIYANQILRKVRDNAITFDNDLQLTSRVKRTYHKGFGAYLEHINKDIFFLVYVEAGVSMADFAYYLNWAIVHNYQEVEKHPPPGWTSSSVPRKWLSKPKWTKEGYLQGNLDKRATPWLRTPAYSYTALANTQNWQRGQGQTPESEMGQIVFTIFSGPHPIDWYSAWRISGLGDVPMGIDTPPTQSLDNHGQTSSVISHTPT